MTKANIPDQEGKGKALVEPCRRPWTSMDVSGGEAQPLLGTGMSSQTTGRL